ncbi:Hypothetical protein CpP54B96_1442 [Corynebacterium pseudotuberculosis P54B96]|nr:Hypothetical protein CpPAT10_1416a [Corynebacterium pseudotuberculosis PAT10]AFF22573.1 Hypothetical protein CpP54B96_1442 [Corynebacterium pseudotuberculosis P54B96]
MGVVLFKIKERWDLLSNGFITRGFLLMGGHKALPFRNLIETFELVPCDGAART